MLFDSLGDVFQRQSTLFFPTLIITLLHKFSDLLELIMSKSSSKIQILFMEKKYQKFVYGDENGIFELTGGRIIDRKT